MLLTVTANPSTDRILHVPQLIPGRVHRATDVQLLAAGKGVNVARAARSLGAETLATGILAGRNGQILADLAAAENLPADWYPLPTGETRVCTLLNHNSGDTTVINENGPLVTDSDWAGFSGHVRRLAAQARAVAFSGSVPPGAPPERLGQLARSLVDGRLQVFVDTSRAPLKAVLDEPAGLWVKVNRGELADGLGVTLTNRPVQYLINSARTVLARGAAGVVVTLGSQGALAVTRRAVWQAVPPNVTIASTVGSGDSMLAGLAVALLRGQSLAQALAFGVACGTANALTGEPGRFKSGELETIRRQMNVHQIPV